MKTALGLKNISEARSLPLEGVLNKLEEAAKSGRYWEPFDMLSPDLVETLLNLGFSVKKHTDPFRPFPNFIVSWHDAK
jgi:hypothetical protein